MIRSALSSAAFVGSGITKVLEAAVEAGAQGVEWTEDGFVPSGDVASARDAMMATLRAGLCTVSYAASFQCGVGDRAAFRAALSTARELNAPFLRLSSAPRGARPAADEARFIDEARFLGDEAGKSGVTLCFGIDAGAVLDSCAGAAGVFATLDHPFVKLAMEPASGFLFDEAMESFQAMAGQVVQLRVRSEDLDGTTGDRSEEWLQLFDAFDEQGGSPDMARHVVVCAIGGDRDRLRAGMSAIKSWGVTLRRYHRRRVY